MFDKLFNRSVAPPAPSTSAPYRPYPTLVHVEGQPVSPELAAAVYEIREVSKRLARMETRLVRLMKHNGLTADGDVPN